MKDIFTDKLGKLSSKRTCGVTLIATGIFMSVLSGLHFYEIDSNLIYYAYGAGSALLGIGVFEKK